MKLKTSKKFPNYSVKRLPRQRLLAAPLSPFWRKMDPLCVAATVASLQQRSERRRQCRVCSAVTGDCCRDGYTRHTALVTVHLQPLHLLSTFNMVVSLAFPNQYLRYNVRCNKVLGLAPWEGGGYTPPGPPPPRLCSLCTAATVFCRTRLFPSPAFGEGRRAGGRRAGRYGGWLGSGPASRRRGQPARPAAQTTTN